MNLTFVDFGLSNFISEDLESKTSAMQQNEYNRNQFFSSRWVLQGFPYTMRDDVISIVYNLLFLMNATTSWFDKYGDEPYLTTLKFKLEASKEELCECKALAPLYEEAYSYTIDEKPNYGKMRFLLEKELIGSYCVPDQIYSFLQHN